MAKVMKLSNPDLVGEKRFASTARTLLRAMDTGDKENEEGTLQLFTLVGDPLIATATPPTAGRGLPRLR
ncbi:hypothetical protein OG723_28630 [Streptomyces sp. NBC_01278]|uniref:hypothetical protein n=1 Tax=Streptomyces sp. NBC_01278 TaxID=2903809 RepID=UPI002E31DD21|nr:hypothetical protein [Streptomyces sp. NBC_01278]